MILPNGPHATISGLRRITLDKKIKEWVCFILREDSNDHKNMVRRWRKKKKLPKYLWYEEV